MNIYQPETWELCSEGTEDGRRAEDHYGAEKFCWKGQDRVKTSHLKGNRYECHITVFKHIASSPACIKQT